jgi:hypothetical protein
MWPILSCAESARSAASSFSFGFQPTCNYNSACFGLAYTLYDSTGYEVCSGLYGGSALLSTAIVSGFQYVSMSLDAVGRVNVYVNGVRQSVAVVGASNCTIFPQPTSIGSCKIGESALTQDTAVGGGQASRWAGSVTGVQFFPRALYDQEMLELAYDRPAALAVQPVALLVSPPTALQGESTYLQLGVQLTGGIEAQVVAAFTAGIGSFLSDTDGDNTVSFTQLGYSTHYFTVVFEAPAPADAAHAAPYWIVHFELVGPGTSSYSAPADLVVYQSGVAQLFAAATYALDTSAPSVDAGWQAGPVAGGVAVFDGVTQHLNPLNRRHVQLPAHPRLRHAGHLCQWLDARVVVRLLRAERRGARRHHQPGRRKRCVQLLAEAAPPATLVRLHV